MNRVILMGRLTRDPNVKIASNGSYITTYTLAVDRDYPERLSGIKTDFFQCVAQGREADFARQYLKKGIKVVVWGSILNDSGFVARDGTRVKLSKIFVKEQEFAERKRDFEKKEDKVNYNRGFFTGLPVDDEGFVRLPENFDEDIPF